MASFTRTGVLLKLTTILLISLAVNNRTLVDSKKNDNYTDVIRSIMKNLKGLKNLSKHLESACVKSFGNKRCMMSKAIQIPGFDSTWRNNMTEEELLKECKKRMTLFSIHMNELQKHESSVKRMKVRVKNFISWLTALQKSRGFSTAISMTRPATLASTGAKTDLDWYRIAMELMKNLKTDFERMYIEFVQRQNT